MSGWEWKQHKESVRESFTEQAGELAQHSLCSLANEEIVAGTMQPDVACLGGGSERRCKQMQLGGCVRSHTLSSPATLAAHDVQMTSGISGAQLGVLCQPLDFLFFRAGILAARVSLFFQVR